MFPEKLTFTKNGYRTARVNEAVRLIFNVGEAFSEIKNGTTDEKSLMYHEVIPTVLFSNLFLHDLALISALAA